MKVAAVHSGLRHRRRFGSPAATNVGIVGCDLWFDVGNWFVLAQPTSTPTRQIGVPPPDIRQLVGVKLALQTFHFPTDSPIRADPTIGVRVRLGSESARAVLTRLG